MERGLKESDVGPVNCIGRSHLMKLGMGISGLERSLSKSIRIAFAADAASTTWFGDPGYFFPFSIQSSGLNTPGKVRSMVFIIECSF